MPIGSVCVLQALDAGDGYEETILVVTERRENTAWRYEAFAVNEWRESRDSTFAEGRIRSERRITSQCDSERMRQLLRRVRALEGETMRQNTIAADDRTSTYASLYIVRQTASVLAAR